MKKAILMAALALPLFAEQLSYEEPKRDVNAYISKVADEKLFLEPFLKEEISDLADKIILDAGRSTGIWGSKRQPGEGVEFAYVEGDVSALPYADDSFSYLLSLNIGSSLPSSIYLSCENSSLDYGLEAHCCELARVMRVGGKMLIVAPASFDQVFSDGSIQESELSAKIERVLGQIGSSDDPDRIMRMLEELQEVNRATFVHRGDRLILVTDEKELQVGEQIWRKEPDGVRLSFFHSEEEYLIAFNRVGLQCEEIRRPCFYSKLKHDLYNASVESGQGLGRTYIENNPFTIFTVVKSA